VWGKTDDQLYTTKYGNWLAELDEEFNEEEYQRPEKVEKIVLEEYHLETGTEKAEATRLYFVHGERLAKLR